MLGAAFLALALQAPSPSKPWAKPARQGEKSGSGKNRDKVKAARKQRVRTR